MILEITFPFERKDGFEVLELGEPVWAKKWNFSHVVNKKHMIGHRCRGKIWYSCFLRQ